MNIAVIGTGRVGRSIGGGLSAAGHDVVFASRNPSEQSGLPAPAVDLKSAAGGAEVVIDAIPGSVVLETLNELGADLLAGKILMEVANDIGPGFVLNHPNASLGAAVQAALPDTRVVKTLNTVQAPLMNNPSALPSPSSVFLAGNDAGAKSTVSGLLADLGWDPGWHIDLGDISQAKATEHYIFLSFAIAQSLGTTSTNISVIRA